MLPNARSREVAVSAYYALSGRGGGFLQHKREYHRRREEMEREFLRRAETDGSLMRRVACPACGDHTGAFAFASPVGFNFDRCAADGTIYMNPAPTEESLGELYNHPGETYLWTAGGARGVENVKASDQEDLDALSRMLGTRVGGRLLDIGCATGGFLLSARNVFDVEGVELNATTAEIARAHGLKVTIGRLADFSTDGGFDVLTLLQVFEHLVDGAALLRAARRALKPGGALYINMPAVETASFDLLGRHHVHVASFAHVSLYTKRGVEKLAERCGFRVESHEYCGGLDLAVHDLLTWRLSRAEFSHRMAGYRSRLYFASNAIERILPMSARRRLLPSGNESYQRMILRPC